MWIHLDLVDGMVGSNRISHTDTHKMNFSETLRDLKIFFAGNCGYDVEKVWPEMPLELCFVAFGFVLNVQLFLSHFMLKL